MTAYRFITTRHVDRTLILTINRPEVMNALHAPAHFECHDALNAFAADASLRVAIITGAGERAFCAGADLKHRAAGGSVDTPPTGVCGLTSRFDLMKPVIAAVNGVALGAGFEIALATDIIVAASNASFGLPEPRVGMAALAGGLHRLPRAIGMKRAMAMILTARTVSAEEGASLGFVHRVTAEGGALDAAFELAAQIEQCSPAALRAAKEVAMLGWDHALPDALAQQVRWTEVRAARASPDAIEGPLAFAEKRSPRWRDQ